MWCPAVVAGLVHLQTWTSSRQCCVTAGPFMPHRVSLSLLKRVLPHSPLPCFSCLPTFTLMSPVSHWLKTSLLRKEGSVWHSHVVNWTGDSISQYSVPALSAAWCNDFSFPQIPVDSFNASITHCKDSTPQLFFADNKEKSGTCQSIAYWRCC